ncbi:MAG: hypothetical protein U1D55_18060 [Phycisphaerae bacterium]
MKRIRRFAVVALIAISASAHAQSLGTAFGYQGRLLAGSAPASGPHDMRFRLFDALSGGTQVGGTICLDDVNVVNGLFTVTLDFGAAFSGQDRYIEIEMRADSGADCSVTTGYTTLAPRQELWATPNATFALNAATATSATTASTATNATQLNGQPAAFYLDATNLTNGTLSASRLPVPLVLAGNGAPGIIQVQNASSNANTIGIHSILSATTAGLNSAAIRAENHGATPAFGYAIWGSHSGNGGGVRGTSIGGVGVIGEGGVGGTGVSGLGGTYGGSFTINEPGQAVRGEVLSTVTGSSVAGSFVNLLAQGTGVYGYCGAPSGATVSGDFQNLSTTGTAVRGNATAASGLSLAAWFQNASTQGTGVYSRATAASGSTYGGEFRNDSTSGIGLFGWASTTTGTTYGLFGRSNSTTGAGVYGDAPSTSGATYGVRGLAISTSGTGVLGEVTTTSGTNYGVVGRAASPNGIGVFGSNTATTLAFGTGVMGQSANVGGIGVYGSATNTGTAQNMGGKFEAAGTQGFGVWARATSTSGATRGGYFESASSTGIGVLANAPASAGTSWGVYGTVNSPDGLPVYGLNNASSGVAMGGSFITSSPTGRALHGRSISATGVNYAVFGEGSPSTTGYAVWAQGRTGASGTKSFRIDHPNDPENRYLLHYCHEGPEPQNVYNGTIVLDAKGEATVQLPDYFASINAAPRYTLTAIGAAMPNLHVGEEISDAALSAGERAAPGEALITASFRIAGGAPGAKVSWEVKAVRNDRWVRQYGSAVELEKEGIERGTYQHPELYGQPMERGMSYRPEITPQDAGVGVPGE